MQTDLRRGLRNLLKSPRFFLVAALSMGLGIAAATTIFTFASSILLRPLPYPESEQLVTLQESVHGERVGGTPARVKDWLQTPSLSHITGYYGENFTMEIGSLPERVAGLRTFGDTLGTYYVQPVLGRGFTPEEQNGKGGVVVISDSLWRTRLGGDRSALGRKIRLNGAPHEIIGILSPGIRIEDADIIAPETNQDLPRWARFLGQVARLRDGAAVEQARTELATVAARLAQTYPDTDANMTVGVVRLRESMGSKARLPLLVLLGAVGFLVLMASINVANLFLARMSGRSSELAVRQALGANRWQIARMLFAESLLVALAGGVLGVLGAVWGVDLLRAAVPAELPRLDEVRLDSTVLLFATLMTLVCAFVSGLLPAWRSSGGDVGVRLKDGARGSRGTQRAAQFLVAVQVALSLALAVGGGLLVRTIWNLDNRPLGFAAGRLLTFRLSLPWQTDSNTLSALYTRVLDELRATPGVESAALVDRLPLDGDSQSGDVMVGGKSEGAYPAGSRLNLRAVSANFHEVMQVPLLSGRALDSADYGKRKAVINEAAARSYFRGENPIGRIIGIRWKSKSNQAPMYEIVGVVANLPDHAREERPAAAAYIPFDQTFWPLANFVVRTRTAPEAMSTEVRKAVLAAGSKEPVELVRSVDTYLASRNQIERLQAWIVAVFAAFAILLAAVGIFGLVAGTVAERRLEIGIRMALGAAPGNVVRETLSRLLRQVALGAAGGLALAAILARTFASTLYGVTTGDSATYVLAALLLLSIALLAAWWPARRASLMDPSKALRRD